MLETIIGGLIIAAVSALSWVAYNHPEEYKRASPKILLASLWGSTLISCWMLSALYSVQQITRGLKKAGHSEAALLVSDLMEPTFIDMSVFSISLLGWMAFMLILEFWVTGLKRGHTPTNPK